MYNIPSGLNPFERADDLSSPLLIRAEEPHPKAFEFFLEVPLLGFVGIALIAPATKVIPDL